MSVWTRVGELLAGGADAVAATVGSIRDLIKVVASGEVRRDVAFTIAMIALSAKMAKADGIVTQDEVRAFREIFQIPKGEERNVSRVYDMAKQGIGGFDSYARDVAGMFVDEPAVLEDILDGLFHIAKADTVIHEGELAYLEQVATIFGFDALAFNRIKGRHALDGANDPYVVLGADPDWDTATLRRHYLDLVTQNHPDRLIARGVPEEFIRIANDRLAAINAAWETIEAQRAKPVSAG
ncbi:MAG: TerB family tellurite resistance protein [Alphaproteobacteria bacterium]